MTHQLFPVIPHGKILYRGQLEVESINEAFYNTLLPGTHHDLQNRIISSVCCSNSFKIYDIFSCNMLQLSTLPMNTSDIIECF